MSMKRTVWTWGLISGGVSSALMLAVVPFADRIGFDRSAIFGYTGLVLSALMIFFGVRSYKQNVAGGRLTFGKGFKVGLLIALISSLLYVATWQVVYFQFMPDFLEKYGAHVAEKARQDGKSAAEIEKMNADMAKFQELYRNPLFNAAITLIEPLPFGLAAAAISAGILRTRRNTAPA
ncbi:MAG: hypothetical protein AMXMBFR36_27180 [Acidobacteriota bacterium]